MDRSCSKCGKEVDRVPSSDGDYYCSKCHEILTSIKVGQILHYTWGYDQTTTSMPKSCGSALRGRP